WSNRVRTPNCSRPGELACTDACGHTSPGDFSPHRHGPGRSAGPVRVYVVCGDADDVDVDVDGVDGVDDDVDGAGKVDVVTVLRSGRCTLKVVDHPGVSTMSTNPSCASATDLAMARPS